MTCPGCGGHSSSVLMAYYDEKPCPFCGLSNEAMSEILSIQRSRADEKLKAQLAEEIKRRSAAEQKAALLQRQIDEIRHVLGEQAG
jgi:hypothetical protein